MSTGPHADIEHAEVPCPAECEIGDMIFECQRTQKPGVRQYHRRHEHHRAEGEYPRRTTIDVAWHEEIALRFCRVCKCTDLMACTPPCSWVGDDLCSGCAESGHA